MLKQPKPKAIDLFSGGGGLSLGLKRAGFQVIGAIEVDALAAETYRTNHRGVLLLNQDICSVSARQLLSTLRLNVGELDLLAGCPPCQGFSKIKTLNGHYPLTDKRNDLVFEFLRFARVLRPKTIMMENVPALGSDGRIDVVRAALKKMGYFIRERILDASNYGVPQRRKRFILLAARGADIAFEPPTLPRTTVRTALALLADYAAVDQLHDTNHRRAPHVQHLISLIPKDGGSRRDLPYEMRLKCHRNFEGFWDVYGRMAWDDVAPTITSGCINPSKGRFLHPNEDRPITLREAAILQGFPLRYRFPLLRGKYATAKLIGNAVPPAFSECQAKSLIATLKNVSPYRPLRSR